MVKRVLLCGNGLFIAGLQASLATVPGLDLQQVDSGTEQIWELIDAWRPDVLIIEIAQLKSAYSLSLLPDFPELKVIGLDIEDNLLQVFSGSISYEPTPEQLLQVIES
jgi:hypothetical protein